MALPNDFFHGNTHPGLSNSIDPSTMAFTGPKIGTAALPSAGFPAFLPGLLFGMQPLAIISGGGFGYKSTDFTVTATGTGAAAARSTGGNVLLTCGSDSTFNTNLQSIDLWTPVPDKWIYGVARVVPSDVTTVGFEFGLGTSAVDPGTTNYTDCIKLKMAVGAGTTVGRVRGDSGTEAASGTLKTFTATAGWVGFKANLGVAKAADTATTVTTGASSTTQTVGSTKHIQAGDLLYFGTSAVYRSVSSVASTTSLVVDTTISTTTAETVTVYRPMGSWWAGSTYAGMTSTDFTAAQLIQLGRILQTPASMYGNLHAKGSASNPTIAYGPAVIMVEN